MRLKANRLFFEHAAKDFKRTGAVVPSSKTLATAMTRELALNHNGTATVLEAGGGTGSITQEIVRHLCRGDCLDVYEIDPKFARLMRQRVREDDVFRRSNAAIKVYNRAIEGIERYPRYDFLISGLPFANFEPDCVRDIFEIFRDVLKPGGICSFYEYILVRSAAKIISGNPANRQRVDGVGRVLREYITRYEFRHEIVIRNFPPALVHHIRFTG